MYLDITFIIITGIILLILSKTSYFKGILDGEIYHIPWWLLTTTLITIIILLLTTVINFYQSLGASSGKTLSMCYLM